MPPSPNLNFWTHQRSQVTLHPPKSSYRIMKIASGVFYMSNVLAAQSAASRQEL